MPSQVAYTAWISLVMLSGAAFHCESNESATATAQLGHSAGSNRPSSVINVAGP